jgi:hypothetical protein
VIRTRFRCQAVTRSYTRKRRAGKEAGTNKQNLKARPSSKCSMMILLSRQRQRRYLFYVSRFYDVILTRKVVYQVVLGGFGRFFGGFCKNHFRQEKVVVFPKHGPDCYHICVMYSRLPTMRRPQAAVLDPSLPPLTSAFGIRESGDERSENLRPSNTMRYVAIVWTSVRDVLLL